MVEAYILVNCESGMAGKAAKKMLDEKGVKSAKVVTGLHDVVVLMESKDLTALANDILEKIQQVAGVTRTVTMVCVDV